jgi:CubicO group peptidase (beta-lactamase class C family)
MKPVLRNLIVATALAALLFGRPATAEDRFPGIEWAHVQAAQDGWSEAELAKAKDWSQRINSTAVMVIHHGVVVAEWGDTIKRTQLASVRKSFLSALIGIAVADKHIALDSTLAQLGIDDNPPSLTDIEKQATVQMLLEARSGIYHAALYETPGMAAKRPARGSHPPGTFWYYNNWDFNALGTIYERATGVGIYDALDRLIAHPIEMQDYRPQDGEYFNGAASIHRAYPIRMSARDLARFALLYLRGGTWAGRQVVPADWVRDSARAYSSSGFGPGYGYLWWTGTAPDGRYAGVSLPAGSVFAWGAGGQYAFIIPADDVVVVNRVDRDQHLPEPHLSSVAYLLQVILQAGGFDSQR